MLLNIYTHSTSDIMSTLQLRQCTICMRHPICGLNFEVLLQHLRTLHVYASFLQCTLVAVCLEGHLPSWQWCWSSLEKECETFDNNCMLICVLCCKGVCTTGAHGLMVTLGAVHCELMITYCMHNYNVGSST